jgi:DNA-directed RNA polymerase subunit RPC12/RpoP
MSDIKFACPQCEQHIQCEPGYAGMEVACPTCSTRIVVPGTAPAPAPVLALAQAPAPPPPMPAPQTRLATSTGAPPSSGCPSCGAALPRGAVLCTRCGYNLATGQRTVAGRPAPRGRAVAPSGDTKWYKTSYPYLGAFALLMLALLLVGRSGHKDEPSLAIVAYLGLGLLFYLGVRLLTVVLAFKDGMGTGFLCLCLEFYAIRWVYAESENSFLKASYPLLLLLGLLLFLI